MASLYFIWVSERGAKRRYSRFLGSKPARTSDLRRRSRKGSRIVWSFEMVLLSFSSSMMRWVPPSLCRSSSNANQSLNVARSCDPAHREIPSSVSKAHSEIRQPGPAHTQHRLGSKVLRSRPHAASAPHRGRVQSVLPASAHTQQSTPSSPQPASAHAQQSPSELPHPAAPRQPRTAAVRAKVVLPP